MFGWLRRRRERRELRQWREKHDADLAALRDRIERERARALAEDERRRAKRGAAMQPVSTRSNRGVHRPRNR